MQSKVKDLVKEAKEKVWVNFGHDLERAGQQRNKVFWTKIKNVRNGGRKRVNGAVNDKNGNLVIGKRNVMNRWRECFEELLNVESEETEPSMNEEKLL